MKTIELKQVQFLNFKGLRQRKIDFCSATTKISGRNGKGKTSVQDGFSWALFGKNSEGAKQFGIKTLDENGVAIPKIPHEVSVTLSVDGEEVRICRQYNEKWEKPKGGLKEEFKGHEETRMYNDVPCSVKDFEAKINDICTEQVFKMITNPRYFTSLKKDEQRAMLFDMAGDVDDNEIAEGNESFKELLERMNGKTIAEFKREVMAKKKRIKAEAETIPARIDELNRAAVETKTAEAIEKETAETNAELEAIEKQLTDAFENEKAKSGMLMESMKRLNNAKQTYATKRFDFISNAKRNAEAEYEDAYSKKMLKEVEKRNCEIKIKGYADEVETYERMLGQLRGEWMKKHTEEFVWDDSKEVCPTCGRMLDLADIEQTKAKALANFNLYKAEEEKRITEKGDATKKVKEQAEKNLQAERDILAKIDEELKTFAGITRPALDYEKMADGNEELRQLKTTIATLEQEAKAQNEAIQTGGDAKANEELRERKRMLTEKADALKREKVMLQEETKRQERVKELESEFNTMQAEIVRLEGLEYAAAEFSKAKVNAIEDKVNRLFKIVKFKLFEKQVNGEEVETCEATVDGVPYSDLNNAMKIHAGCDIINAISKKVGVSAPVFFDNAESMNQLPNMECQRIALAVSEDEDLVVENIES